MKINIYQINSERDKNRIKFSSYTYTIGRTGNKIQPEIYDKIFDGDVDCNNLEQIYNTFNINPPKGYKGHSLSVSDVIEIKDNTEQMSKGFYYCDSIGFKKIEFSTKHTEERHTMNNNSVSEKEVDCDIENLRAVEKDGTALQYIKEQTPKICLAAVRQNGLALQYVKEQSPEICLAAVRENDLALQYVKETDEKIRVNARMSGNKRTAGKHKKLNNER